MTKWSAKDWIIPREKKKLKLKALLGGRKEAAKTPVRSGGEVKLVNNRFISTQAQYTTIHATQRNTTQQDNICHNATQYARARD